MLQEITSTPLSYAILLVAGIAAGALVVWLEHCWFRRTYDSAKLSVSRIAVISALLGISFPILFMLYGLGIPFFAYAAFAGILCTVMLTDLDTSTIPNPLIIAGIALWLVSVWFMNVPDHPFSIGESFLEEFGNVFIPVMVDGLLAAAIIGGGTLILSVVYEQVTNMPSLGGGDIKLLFTVSLYLGITASLFNIFLACIFGLIFAPIWRRVKKPNATEINQSHHVYGTDGVVSIEVDQDVKTFPFGPAIALASLISILKLHLLFL